VTTTPGTPRPRLLERYRAFLPLSEATPIVSLGEGATPLVHAERLGAAWGIPNLHLKFEGANPTGSFKDRGMVMAVAKALEAGARSIVCASTGNTSASAAAYGAAAGLEVVVVLPAGKIAAGKLLQAQAAGARVLAVEGNFDAALRIVRELAEQDEHPITLVNSVNPFRLEGQKTAAFEVCEDLGRAPDVLAIPVGNAGNISAYWMGFRAWRAAGRIDALPRMWGFRIGNPASWDKAIAARDESGGLIEAVSEEEIFAAYRDVVRHAGIFCEPASAASLAGVRRLREAGRLDPDALVVCVLTGHGLKDPDTAGRLADPLVTAAPTRPAVMEALGWRF
jgi:threonine synthase